VTDAVLVKADGARTRLFKTPGESESRVPEATDTVIPVTSVHAVGEPLSDDAVHRPGRVAAPTDRDSGDTTRPVDVATIRWFRSGSRERDPVPLAD